MAAKFSANQFVIVSGVLAVVGYLAFTVACMAATGELAAIWRLLRTRLPDGQEAPDFDPKNSASVNLTVVTTALGAILSGSFLPAPSTAHPDAHTIYLPDAHTYTYLNIFFAALLALALLVYWASRYAAFYLAADSLALWGATGAVATAIFAIAELDGYSWVNRAIFIALLTVGFLLVGYGRLSATRAELERLKSVIAARAKSGHKGELPPAMSPQLRVQWQIK